MYTYKFVGKLEPENLIHDLKITSSVGLKHPNFGIEGNLSIVVDRTLIELTYHSELDHTANQNANLDTLKNFIQDTVQHVINLYGYCHSIALDVYLTSVTCTELNLDYRFGIKGELNINKSDKEVEREFNKLFSIFAKPQNSQLMAVFADFHKAIKYPATTAQFCFRAVETIRVGYFEDPSITNPDQRRKKGWETMNTELGYANKDFEEIMNHGIPNRHGVYPVITYPAREKIMNFTRGFIDKFIETKIIG